MADTYWSDGKWMYRREWDEWIYRKPGMYDPSIMLDYKDESFIRVQADAIARLIPELEAEGWLKPRLDDRIRNEDLKIIHRLMDLLERNQP